MADVLAGKRLEVLKESIPKLSRVAVLWYPSGSNEPQWQESQLAARQLGLQLHKFFGLTLIPLPLALGPLGATLFGGQSNTVSSKR
jgi:hypothetical protein